jgi:hypothetical protein
MRGFVILLLINLCSSFKSSLFSQRLESSISLNLVPKKFEFRSFTRHQVRKNKLARILSDELIQIVKVPLIKAKSYPSEFLLRGISFPRIHINDDFSHGNVYVSSIGNAVERRRVYIWLCENLKQIRFALHSRLRRFRRLPIIAFKLYDIEQSLSLYKEMETIKDELIETSSPKRPNLSKILDFDEKCSSS